MTRARLSALAATLLGAALLVFAPAAAASFPPQLWQRCGSTDPVGQQCRVPRGVAANPANGHVFVADQGNHRVLEFSAWGVFLRAWGWDVVASGPGDDTSPPEDQFEVCVPANGDTCQAGSAGGGVGQFNRDVGVALDSSGNVYVADFFNRRVQKFSPTGQFLLTFGGKVNKTEVEAAAPEAQQNLCTAASGDVCQAGVEGTGDGQFGWSAVFGAFITIDPAGNVYVGDQDRIQRFDTAGAYQSQIALPGLTVRALASDAAGNLYAAYSGKTGIHKLSPTGEALSPTFELPQFSLFFKSVPTAVAVDPAGNVYAFGPVNVESFDRDPLVEFAPDGSQLANFGKGEFASSEGPGLAASPVTAAGGVALYVTNLSASQPFLRAYSPLPDIAIAGPPPPAPPEIKAQYAVSVDGEGALLRAQINPHFWPDGTYHLEYGTADCAIASCEGRLPASGELQLPGGSTDRDITTPGVVLSGLSPNTTYYYRFLAQSGGGGPVRGAGGTPGIDGPSASFTTPGPIASPQADCPNQAMRSGPSAFLPDCRAFELVSPVDKNGGGIETFAAYGGVAAALDESTPQGTRITYSAKVAFGDAISGAWSNQYVSRRDPAQGWSTHSIAPTQENWPGSEGQAFDTEFKAFSADLSQAWLIHQAEPPLAPCAPAGSADLYRRDNASGSYEALHCEANKLHAKAWNAIELLGVSEDGCHAVFNSNSKLSADAGPAGPYQLYESSCEAPGSPEGPLRFIGTLPGEAKCAKDSTAGSSSGANSRDGRAGGVWHALSADAHRLYWSCGDRLYLRSDPDLGAVGDESVTEVAGPSAGAPPLFQLASPDGSRALFTARAGGEYVLRSYDAASGETTTIAGGLETGEGVAVERLPLLGASEDATRAYFVSKKLLTGAPNSEGDVALEGRPNLYLHQEGGGFAFLGTLADRDLKGGAFTPSPVHSLPLRRASRVSPDGLHAAFVSSAPLTGYDNADVRSGEADAELFVYDATAEGGAGQTLCVSCNPTGARPLGRDISSNEGEVDLLRFRASAWIPGWQTQLYPGRPLSADGRRLFFNSFDALLPRDTNGREDVYEWEQVDGEGKAGEEECTEIGAELYVAAAGGCLSLISSGHDPSDSEFIDADSDGSDVFIRTGQSLLPQDPGLVDVYDARIEGGFPQPNPPAACEGEACQTPPAAPDDPTPASAAFEGAGNVAEAGAKPRCKKPRVRRKGHCVKAHKKRRGAQQGRTHR